MRKTSPSQNEDPLRNTRTVNAYADQAEALARRHSKPYSVWMAIKNEQGSNRTTIFSDVLDELKRRLR